MASCATDLITSFENFTPSSVSYGKPKLNSRGGKAIKILDSKNNTLVVQTPLMLTWGVNKMVDDDTGRISYSLSLQFPSDDYSNDSIRKFYKDIQELENKVLDDACTYSKEWFGKQKMSREVAEALFSPMLKFPKDKDSGEPDYTRNPTMRVKVPYWEGKFNIELYDIEGNLIFNQDTDLDTKPLENCVPKASHCSCILQCNGLWFAAGKFGVTWQLVQSVIRRPVRIQGQCFIKLNSDDRKIVKHVEEREELEGQENGEEVDDTFVDDSDNEDVKEGNTVSKVEPVKEDEPEVYEEDFKPRKKTIRKKKVVKKSG